MQIAKIKINNFRLLKNVEFELDNDINVIVGKNNSGKTSLLYCLDKFLNNTNFRYEDLSIDVQNDLEFLIISDEIPEDEFKNKNLKIYIELSISYDESDNISMLSRLMTDLEDDSNIVRLCFEYYISYDNYKKLRSDYNELEKEIKDLKNVNWFLSKNFKKYFQITKYAYDIDKNNSVNISEELLKKIINFQYINAKREVANDEPQKNSIREQLSKLSYQFLKNNKDSDLKEEIENLNKELLKMDLRLDENYKKIFESLFKDLSEYGFAKEGAEIEIQSRLSENNIIQDNTLLLYNIEGKKFPETFNGLGYLNFFALILKINNIIKDMKDKTSASINLLIIEEPEAHTHPQMQYIFINNIKSIIKKYSDGISLNTILTTHSPQILSQSNYENILCFIRSNNESKIKSLSKFLTKLGNDDKKSFDYIKKYLTLTNSEIFFADKVIAIEGTTERILLPVFIKIIDKNSSDLKLASQNISIIESGAYAKNLDPLLKFLGVKTLIITDIDFINKRGNKCRYDKAISTSNSTIKFYMGNDFEKIKQQEKVFECDNIGLVFQHYANNYHARSFEDEYISSNYEFINKNLDKFKSLKCKKHFENPADYYDIAENCIKEKSSFAAEIIYNSDLSFSNILIPEYIKDGLLWLREQ